MALGKRLGKDAKLRALVDQALALPEMDPCSLTETDPRGEG